MAEFKNPIDQFIHELGGTGAVATELGVARSLVSTWRTKGAIPYWRVEPVLKLAERKRKDMPSLSIPEALAA